MIREVINELKKYTVGKKNTEKVEISVLQLNRVIKALEQEPCEDVISRQAAIDTIESWLSCDDYNEAERHIMRAMQSVLYDLPSVKPQEPKTIQEKQAESEKYQKAFDDGYENGYTQARFDYEQEPCEDAISRDAVWDVMQELWGTSGELLDRLMALPSVNPQPKTGHWKKKEDDTCWWYVCSECEQEPLKNRWNDDDVLSTFCPECGAQMVEPQESEE